MANVELISTENLLPQRCAAAFRNEAVCETFRQLEAYPHDPSRFNASLQRVELGELMLARAVAGQPGAAFTDTRAGPTSRSSACTCRRAATA
jgi:hypothetical protein